LYNSEYFNLKIYFQNFQGNKHESGGMLLLRANPKNIFQLAVDKQASFNIFPSKNELELLTN
jgi:hypothetical protein